MLIFKHRSLVKRKQSVLDGVTSNCRYALDGVSVNNKKMIALTVISNNRLFIGKYGRSKCVIRENGTDKWKNGGGENKGWDRLMVGVGLGNR